MTTLEKLITGREKVTANIHDELLIKKEQLLKLTDMAIKGERLEAAIKEHRAQKLDDRCWMDDQKLYAVLGDGNLGDNSTPPKDKMLENCRRYIDQRCKPGNWITYAELEQQLIAKNKEIDDLQERIFQLS